MTFFGVRNDILGFAVTVVGHAMTFGGSARDGAMLRVKELGERRVEPFVLYKHIIFRGLDYVRKVNIALCRRSHLGRVYNSKPVRERVRSSNVGGDYICYIG